MCPLHSQLSQGRRSIPNMTMIAVMPRYSTTPLCVFAQYADPVADLLDQWGVFRARLFRESCVFHRGNYVKDLSRLGRELSKVIIVDNSPASYIFHPENAVSRFTALEICFSLVALVQAQQQSSNKLVLILMVSHYDQWALPPLICHAVSEAVFSQRSMSAPLWSCSAATLLAFDAFAS